MKIKVNDFIFYESKEYVHTKASERYIDVEMIYPTGKFEGWIPIEYRRTGINIKEQKEISEYLISIYPYLDPAKEKEWMEESEKFWREEKPNALETKPIFDILKQGGWKCVNCEIKNPNWARRFQDMKEFGFTFSTKTPINCPICGKRSTYIMCVHIPRNINSEGNGYETWSSKLRKRIISVLKSYDAYEGKVSSTLLPDHKFSEIRWDDGTKSTNPDDMTDLEIINKFQLMTNQRNQQKREVCRRCFQTGERQGIFGIDFFWRGEKQWDKEIPVKGKEAEKGCIGCPWHDIEKWRKELLKKIR